MNKISILLPVKNATPYLTRCLESILAQTEQNWELLAVNDHSTDDSLAVLNRFAEKDPRIKVLDNQGQGIIPALRLAFTSSNGHLITRMDADDIMPEVKLAVLKGQLLEKGIGHLATGQVAYFSDGHLGEGYQKYASWLNNLCVMNHHYQEIYKECVIPSPCWMTFREDLIKCQAFDPQTLPEDYDLVFRFYKNKLMVLASNEVLHHWRDHGERSSRNLPEYAQNSYLDLKIPYFLELNFEETRPLVLYGAGKKGKTIAKKLIHHKVPFHWLTNNPRKIGHEIYQVILESDQILSKIQDPQIIIAVAGQEDQDAIQANLDALDLVKARNYWYFC